MRVINFKINKVKPREAKPSKIWLSLKYRTGHRGTGNGEWGTGDL